MRVTGVSGLVAKVLFNERTKIRETTTANLLFMQYLRHCPIFRRAKTA